MSWRGDKSLTEKQVNAVRILMRQRDMPLTEKVTSKQAINRTTAWGLQDAGIAHNFFDPRDGIPWKERVRLLPAVKQLLAELERKR